MFSSSPLDKNCINSDSCSSSRNNAPNRFSVGVAPLGDENQQIRIQLAVHKYNGTAGSPFNNRCSIVSPGRHSFLKNSLKARNYEGEQEGTSKTDKRKGNQYEGVGSFPTVHLKKNAVRYRPIRRFRDVKIPYPEIPVNRFLSHLPEVCPDLKPSTRSVLDVLEDLSGNKIHSKDGNGGVMPKPRGLGGDYLVNPNAVFKPLFVQKPKLNAVLTRDNTTQTLSPVSIETPSPQSSTSSCVRNGTSDPDPRAELRRKLAKQNNEIFASLSSSISSDFCLKRKIDKVLPSRGDGQLSEGSAQKKSKTSNNSHNVSENGLAKSAVSPANSRESVKLNRKTKFSDANSLSPNKDRLTTIFLDTRNPSPKAQMFQANASNPEDKSGERGAQVAGGGSLGGQSDSAEKTTSSFGGSFTGDKEKDESSGNSTSISSSGKPAPDKPVVNLITDNSNTGKTDTPKSTSSTLKFDVSSPNTQMGTASSLSETPKSTVNGNESEKKESESKDASKGFVFGSTSDKPQFGSFKFGVDGTTTSPAQNKAFTDIKQAAPEAVSTGGLIATNPTPQFSLSSATSVTAPTLQTSGFQFGVISSQNATFTSPTKPTFTFGQNPSPAQQNSTIADGKQETSVTTSTSVATTQSTVPATFTFGQKSNVEPATTTSAKQDILSPPNEMSQSKPVNFMSGFGKNSQTSTETSGSVFALGQKPETSVASAGPAAPVQQQIKTFPFVFGQKSDVGQNDAKIESGQKSGDLVSTEQKSASQVPAEGSTVSTGLTAPGQPSVTQMNQTFTQNGSLTTVAPPATFTQTSTAFGSSLNGFSTAGSVFSNKPISFGTSVNAFGKTTSQTTTGFATSTSSAPAFGFPASTTTQSSSTFGASPATQSAPTFGSTSTVQSTSPFPSSSVSQTTPAFGASTSHSTPGFVVPSTTQTQPTFGTSSAPLSTPAFGSSTKQTGLSFGTTSTTQSTSTFSSVSSQPAPLFGSAAPTQTTFTSPTPFGLPSSQSSSVFGTPTSSQSPLRFGSTTTQNNSTFGSSSGFTTAPSTQSTPAFGAPTSTPAFPSPLDNKPAASLSQTPSIFGQNPSSAFSSTTSFNSTQNNIFAPKPSAETPMFGQNKLQTSGFGSTGQTFGASQEKFSFVMSTSASTGFTTSPPTTTAPMVFSFGGGTNNAFSFGGNSSGSSNASTPFAFRTPANEPFKFGAATTAAATTTTTTTKEGTVFGGGGTGSSSFSFAGQMANPSVADQKPSFNFGGAQTSTATPGFNFGTTPSPSLFNFGGSTSSGSSGSNFNFGTSTPAFGQGAASPGTPFSVPGTFSIGSGSSQPRPRASTRPRRRQ